MAASLAGFTTPASTGLDTPASWGRHTCLPDPHAGMPRSAGRWCLPQSRMLYKVGQAWVSGKGVSFQKFQERQYVGTSTRMNEDQAGELEPQTPPWLEPLPSGGLGKSPDHPGFSLLLKKGAYRGAGAITLL